MSVIIAVLGGGLFFVIRHQVAAQLDRSLETAAARFANAARTRGVEDLGAKGTIAEAIGSSDVPVRALFLLDLAGAAVLPPSPADWIADAARIAGQRGSFFAEGEAASDRSFRLYAQKLQLASGRHLVAVAVADEIEMEDRYAALIGAFAGVALIGVVLVTGGGWLLVRKSTAPIERNIEHMQRFVADAAHELRSPVTVLRTRAEVALQQPRDAAGYVASLRAIECDSERLADILDSLLVLTRADAGQLPLAKRRLFLDDLALDAATTARLVAQAKGVEVTMERFEEAPVAGDEGLLRRLIAILLDNAVKFTSAGGSVRVGVELSGGYPSLRVEDSGIGIPPEHLPHVFDRFYRGETDRSRDAKGAGLGLSIAQRIADMHDAGISIASAEGGGTRVVVRFPPDEPAAKSARVV